MAGMSFPAPPGQVRPRRTGQSIPQIDELVVPYAYERVEAEVARRKSIMLMRVVSLCITAVILIGLQIWRQVRDVDSAVFGWPYFLALGVSIGLSLSFLGYAIVRWLQARKRAAALRPGPVLIIARPGVELSGEQVPWSMVTGLQARSQRFGGDVFIVHRDGAPPLQIPFDLLDVAPSSLDSAARAFSGARVGVDFAKMDN